MDVSSEDGYRDEDDSLDLSFPPASSPLAREPPSALNDCLLKFDVVAESAYLPGNTNEIFDINLRMKLEARLKQYERTTGRDQSVVGVQIDAPGFTLVFTPEQISGWLTKKADCKEFEWVYVDIIHTLIPPEGYVLALLDNVKVIEKGTLYIESDLPSQRLNYIVIDPTGSVVKGNINSVELPSLKGKLEDPARLIELLQPLLPDILIITSGKKNTTLKFKNTIKVYSKCSSHSEMIEITRQSILTKIQQGRAFGSYAICKASPSKLTRSQHTRINRAVFVPKLTASIMVSIDSLDESLTLRPVELASIPSPRAVSPRELLSGTSGGSPLLATAPTPIANSLAHESSPRQKLTHQTSSSRFLCFFKRQGSGLFVHKEAPKQDIPTHKVSGLGVPARHNLPTIELGHSPVEHSRREQSPQSSSSTESSSPAKFAQHTIRVRKNSFGGNQSGDLSTEIRYSPRERSGSFPRPQSPSQASAEKEYCKDILIYCQGQIIQWCGDHLLQYERTKNKFTIYLNDHDAFIIQGNTIRTNSLESAVITLMTDLLHRLDFIEDVFIRHDSMDPAVDRMIVSGLTCSPRSISDEIDEEIQGDSTFSNKIN